MSSLTPAKKSPRSGVDQQPSSLRRSSTRYDPVLRRILDGELIFLHQSLANPETIGSGIANDVSSSMLRHIVESLGGHITSSLTQNTTIVLSNSQQGSSLQNLIEAISKVGSKAKILQEEWLDACIDSKVKAPFEPYILDFNVIKVQTQHLTTNIQQKTSAMSPKPDKEKVESSRKILTPSRSALETFSTRFSSGKRSQTKNPVPSLLDDEQKIQNFISNSFYIFKPSAIERNREAQTNRSLYKSRQSETLDSSVNINHQVSRQNRSEGQSQKGGSRLPSQFNELNKDHIKSKNVGAQNNGVIMTQQAQEAAKLPSLNNPSPVNGILINGSQSYLRKSRNEKRVRFQLPEKLVDLQQTAQMLSSDQQADSEDPELKNRMSTRSIKNQYLLSKANNKKRNFRRLKSGSLETKLSSICKNVKAQLAKNIKEDSPEAKSQTNLNQQPTSNQPNLLVQKIAVNQQASGVNKMQKIKSTQIMASQDKIKPKRGSFKKQQIGKAIVSKDKNTKSSQGKKDNQARPVKKKKDSIQHLLILGESFILPEAYKKISEIQASTESATPNVRHLRPRFPEVSAQVQKSPKLERSLQKREDRNSQGQYNNLKTENSKSITKKEAKDFQSVQVQKIKKQSKNTIDSKGLKIWDEVIGMKLEDFRGHSMVKTQTKVKIQQYSKSKNAENLQQSLQKSSKKKSKGALQITCRDHRIRLDINKFLNQSQQNKKEIVLLDFANLESSSTNSYYVCDTAYKWDVLYAASIVPSSHIISEKFVQKMQKSGNKSLMTAVKECKVDVKVNKQLLKKYLIRLIYYPIHGQQLYQVLKRLEARVILGVDMETIMTANAEPCLMVTNRKLPGILPTFYEFVNETELINRLIDIN